MSYEDIDHADIWLRFFQDASENQYRIFLHTVNDISSTVLPSCTRIPTIPTKWGEFSLVAVQQALFEKACEDTDVYKCILLSGDSLPLYSFNYLYTKLIADAKGYMWYRYTPSTRRRPVNHAENIKTSKMNTAAWPSSLPLKCAVTYQWCILHRDHIKCISDNFPMLTAVFEPSFIPDERMYAVFFTGVGQLNSFCLDAPMWIHWNGKIQECSEKHRNRPVTFHTSDFTEALIDRIYTTKSLFMRKICKTADITIDWTADKLLKPFQSAKQQSQQSQQPQQSHQSQPSQEQQQQAFYRRMKRFKRL
jgi:hypothetical protein